MELRSIGMVSYDGDFVCVCKVGVFGFRRKILVLNNKCGPRASDSVPGGDSRKELPVLEYSNESWVLCNCCLPGAGSG